MKVILDYMGRAHEALLDSTRLALGGFPLRLRRELLWTVNVLRIRWVITECMTSRMVPSPVQEGVLFMEENSVEPVVVPTTAKKEAPIIQARLRHKILKMPEESWKASGIRIFGRKIRSLVYTTDLAVIKNCDADAVFAIYPFTPQQSISEAIIDASSIPVFCGIGGGTTRGVRTVTLAHDVECQGAMGVVLNSPISNVNLRAVSLAIDIPTVITVVSADTDIAARIDAGAAIINVAGGKDTPTIVSKIREKFPDVPIIASSGGTEESTRATVEAGANAVTYTPPASAILFKQMMAQYRSPASTAEQPQHTALEVLQAAGLWHDRNGQNQ